jgi:cell division protein FtsW (lipid II flippase)
VATIVSYAPRTRRTTHALLLAAAVAVSVVAWVLVDVGRYGSIGPQVPLVAGVLAGIGLVLFVVTALRTPYADPVILPIVLLLNGLGLALIHTVDTARAVNQGATFAYADRQLMWTAVGAGAACLLVTVLRDHRLLRRFTMISMLLGLILLLLPLLPVIGQEINGAQIWITLFGFSFQPAELAKICFAVFFAGYLATHRDTLSLAGPRVLGLTLPRWRDLGPIAVAWLVAVAVLVFETDLGTSLLFFGMFVAALYIATERISWLIIGAISFLPPAVFAALQVSHVQTRFAGWLNAFDDSVYYGSSGNSQQLVTGIFGMANGGILGTGLGQGRPDLVPYAWSDFIVTTLGEELGMVGVFAVLMLFLVLTQRFFRAAVGLNDNFGKVLAGTLGFSLALQAFIVVGGVTRVIPLTGLVMPFMAAGGSNLVVNWLIIALLLRISDQARRPAPGDLRHAGRQARSRANGSQDARPEEAAS